MNYMISPQDSQFLCPNTCMVSAHRFMSLINNNYGIQPNIPTKSLDFSGAQPWYVFYSIINHSFIVRKKWFAQTVITLTVWSVVVLSGIVRAQNFTCTELLSSLVKLVQQRPLCLLLNYLISDDKKTLTIYQLSTIFASFQFLLINIFEEFMTRLH